MTFSCILVADVTETRGRSTSAEGGGDAGARARTREDAGARARTRNHVRGRGSTREHARARARTRVVNTQILLIFCASTVHRLAMNARELRERLRHDKETLLAILRRRQRRAHRPQRSQRSRAAPSFTIQRQRRGNAVDGNTRYVGTSMNAVDGLRSIPRNKRVYLETDVSPSGRIKHVYNMMGLMQWLRRNPTSPFTRRRVTANGVRRLET